MLPGMSKIERFVYRFFTQIIRPSFITFRKALFEMNVAKNKRVVSIRQSVVRRLLQDLPLISHIKR